MLQIFTILIAAICTDYRRYFYSGRQHEWGFLKTSLGQSAAFDGQAKNFYWSTKPVYNLHSCWRALLASMKLKIFLPWQALLFVIMRQWQWQVLYWAMDLVFLFWLSLCPGYLEVCQTVFVLIVVEDFDTCAETSSNS